MSHTLQRLWRFPWIHTLSLAVASAIVLGLITATTVRHVIVVILLLYTLPVVVPIVTGSLLVTLAWWVWRRSTAAMNILRYCTAILLFLGVNCVVSVLTVLMVARSDEEAAMAYCETIIPYIERHAAEQGSYPNTLSQIQALPRHPRGGAECAYDRSDEGYILKVFHGNGYMDSSFVFHQVPE